MKTLKISQDVVTLAEFKSQAATLLERIGTSSQPLLITQMASLREFYCPLQSSTEFKSKRLLDL